MTPDEFFKAMQGKPGCTISATINHVDHPTKALRIEFENRQVYELFMAKAQELAKLVGHAGKVTIVLICTCGNVKEVPL